MIAPGVVPPTNILPQVAPIDMEAWARANKAQASKLKLKTPQNRAPQLRDEMLIRNSDSGKSKRWLAFHGRNALIRAKWLCVQRNSTVFVIYCCRRLGFFLPIYEHYPYLFESNVFYFGRHFTY